MTRGQVSRENIVLYYSIPFFNVWDCDLCDFIFVALFGNVLSNLSQWTMHVECKYVSHVCKNEIVFLKFGLQNQNGNQ